LIEQFKNFDLHNKKKITVVQFNKVLMDFFGNFKILSNEDIHNITA